MGQDKITSGLYQTASDVIHEALRLLNERDTLVQKRLCGLRADIQKGLESCPATPLDKQEFFSGVK